MIDFADHDKGHTIHDLNLLTRSDMIKLNASVELKDDDDQDDEAVRSYASAALRPRAAFGRVPSRAIFRRH
jgi:hypothetical protein